MKSEPELDWAPVAVFASRMIHDFRNYLYGIGLEATLLSETATDPESKQSVARLQNQLQEATEILKALSQKLSVTPPKLRSVSPTALFQVIHEEARKIEGIPQIVWDDQIPAVSVRVDPANFAVVARELLENAARFADEKPLLKISSRSREGNVHFEFIERKSDPLSPENWGRKPFVFQQQGGYGIGLWHAHRVVEANGGTLAQTFNTKTNELYSTISFPVTESRACSE